MKKTLLISAAAALSLAGWCLHHCFFRGMNSAEVVRKLQGLRLAVELFRQAHGRLPSGIDEVVKSGSLEAVPRLKLRGHFPAVSVRNAAAAAPEDTGGWGYVNDPKSRSFGAVFIDCSHRDEKGRPWSDF